MSIFQKIRAIFIENAEKKTDPTVTDQKTGERYFQREPMSDIEMERIRREHERLERKMDRYDRIPHRSIKHRDYDSQYEDF